MSGGARTIECVELDDHGEFRLMDFCFEDLRILTYEYGLEFNPSTGPIDAIFCYRHTDREHPARLRDRLHERGASDLLTVFVDHSSPWGYRFLVYTSTGDVATPDRKTTNPTPTIRHWLRTITTRSANAYHLRVDEQAQLEVVIRGVLDVIDEGGLLDDEMAELQSSIDTIAAQIKSPRPHRGIIGASLVRVATFTGGLLTGVAGNYLSDLLKRFPPMHWPL